jgi:hypothetical protein
MDIHECVHIARVLPIECEGNGLGGAISCLQLELRPSYRKAQYVSRPERVLASTISEMQYPEGSSERAKDSQARRSAARNP